MKAEYGMSVQIAPDVWKKAAITLDGLPGETEEQLLTRTANIVENWFRERYYAKQEAPQPPLEIPIINRVDQRLIELIEDAKSINELMSYSKQCTAGPTQEAFLKKYRELINA